jgi:hemerythrin-like domain-containing protein
MLLCEWARGVTLERVMSPNLVKAPRRFILKSGLAAASAVFVTQARAENHSAKKVAKVADVTPPEDLMREHGVLDRVLLIYEAAMRKFSANADFDPKVISDSANVVQDFIENYHEKSEENFIFPRFRKSEQLLDLVETLLQQHEAGRRVTQTILQNAAASRQDGEARRQTIAAMQAFIAMYRPHAAREDTVLFPKLRKIVSAHEFDAIGEDMEKQEHQHFGEDGFEKTAAHITELEKVVGIDDLRQFTPKG